jgi:hypothetical protein
VAIPAIGSGISDSAMMASPATGITHSGNGFSSGLRKLSSQHVQEIQDKPDHYNESNEPNNTVHVFSPQSTDFIVAGARGSRWSKEIIPISTCSPGRSRYASRMQRLLSIALVAGLSLATIGLCARSKHAASIIGSFRPEGGQVFSRTAV